VASVYRLTVNFRQKFMQNRQDRNRQAKHLSQRVDVSEDWAQGEGERMAVGPEKKWNTFEA